MGHPYLGMRAPGGWPTVITGMAAGTTEVR